MKDKDTYTSKKFENFKKKFAPYTLPKTLVEFIKFTATIKINKLK